MREWAGDAMSLPANELALAESGPDSRAEFAARVRECQRRVFQMARGVLGNSEDAEEVAQDAFLRAHLKFAQLREPAKFRQWVCRIAFRLALNRQRGRRRQLARDAAWHAQTARASGESHDPSGAQISQQRLRTAVDGLPEKLRAALLLCAVEEMDATEAGAILGIPAGTVRSRLHLARKRLLGALSE